MPQKSVPVGDFTTIIISVITLCMGGISAYIAVLIKNINLKIDSLKKEIAENKIDQKECNKETKGLFNEVFDRIRDIENITTVIKTEHDKNHGGHHGN
jgi:hypothetical protein